MYTIYIARLTCVVFLVNLICSFYLSSFRLNLYFVTSYDVGLELGITRHRPNKT